MLDGSFTAPLVLNTLSLLCILSGAYYSLSFYRKPVLAWDVPLHLSYQDFTVRHSRYLARYDAESWNRLLGGAGALTTTLTLLAFLLQQHYHARRTYLAQARAALDKGGAFVSRAKAGSASHAAFRPGRATLLLVLLAALLGTELAPALLGLHPFVWTVPVPIRQVSTAAIVEELTNVPAAAPWDVSGIMQRSAFERTVSQKGRRAALEVTHRYLARHLLEPQAVRVGEAVYPSVRTYGVGAAPVPWQQKVGGRGGYRVDPGYRVLSYNPIMAGTNVTVSCKDKTDEWAWEYHSAEMPGGGTPPVVVHHFVVEPKTDWNTRGSRHDVTYAEAGGINLETWQAMWKSDDTGDAEVELRQIFLFANVGAIDRQPEIKVIECAYGGFDVVRQVFMTSPLEPITFGEVLAVKDALTWWDLWPASQAIESALGRDGDAMVAGMRAALFTSFEMWDYFQGRTMDLPELIEHVLVDTAQAYFSLVRQWREEAQFFSWGSEFPRGQLTATTRRLGGGDGWGGLGYLVMLGLLAALPLTSLWRLVGSGYKDFKSMRRRDFSERFELKDGVIRKKED